MGNSTKEAVVVNATTSVHSMKFALPSWYKTFRHVTIPSLFVPVSPQFIELLEADGVQVPEAVEAKFPIEYKLITDALAKFDNEIFVKLNWSCPKDAKWMLGTLKCSSVNDVLLLLQSSDFIQHDLQYNKTLQHQHLVCREWYGQMRDSMQFRVFIKSQELIGISPRSNTTVDFLPELQHKIFHAIQTFIATEVTAAVFQEHDYVLDVYVDLRNTRKPVLLIDFNVFDKDVTDSLLYSWEELNEDSKSKWRCVEDVTTDVIATTLSDSPDLFRLTSSDASTFSDNLSSYRVPIDFVESSLHTPKGMAEFLASVTLSNADALLASKLEE